MPADPLVELGFTETEAAVYVALLNEGPSTGYRIAGKIGKAAANVYQAIESLGLKRAVVIDDTAKRVLRATPVEELLQGLERRFQKRKKAAFEQLQSLEKGGSDDRFYNLASLDQAYDKARAMIAAAREILLFDLFPSPLAVLGDDLAAAAARGVKVAGVVYGEPGRYRFSAFARRPTLPERWPGEQMTIVADAAQALIALIARDTRTIVHALWTASPYLSCLQHSGLATEIHVSALKQPVGEPLESIGLLAVVPPGLRQLNKANGRSRSSMSLSDAK
jgi:HTH-type transcriptional regulator, sugar sensing transcriptional regulator